MKKNVGGNDKTMRIVIGALSLVLGYLVSPWFYAIALIGFATAFISWCPINHMLGVNTCKMSESKTEKEEVYKCEGTCQGIAHEAKNCGDSTCTHFDKPLIKQ